LTVRGKFSISRQGKDESSLARDEEGIGDPGSGLPVCELMAEKGRKIRDMLFPFRRENFPDGRNEVHSDPVPEVIGREIGRIDPVRNAGVGKNLPYIVASHFQKWPDESPLG
jgi:hypothetical protein